jgi:GPH family glycoside/pentoside/hexuronide:cation symporter
MEKVKTTLKEKIFYAFGNMGSYILWAFIGTYVTIYVTECLKLDKDLISLLGTLILVCRLFDALSDIAMGIIIQKTESKVGKARLWFGISIIPMIIVFFFIFFVSGLDQKAALITISVLYFLFTVVFYTMNCIGFNAMLPRISDDPYDQSNICTINSIFTSVGSLVSAIAIPVLVAFGGEGNQNAWTLFVIILACLAFAGELLCFIFVKEKKEITVTEKEHMSKEAFRTGMKSLFKTKYFYIAVAMFVINYYISLSVVSVGKYYAQWVLNNELAFTWFGSIPMVTMGLGLLMTPFLVKKINKKKTLMLAIACVALGNIIGSCFPFSYAASFVGVMVKGLGSAVVMSQLFTLAPDIVRYIQAKDGVRVEGLAASANSFGSKIGSGLGTAIFLWLIPVCGYDATLTAQPETAIYTFIALYWWVPMVLSLILLLLASFWNIDKRTEQLTLANQTQKETETAQAQQKA